MTEVRAPSRTYSMIGPCSDPPSEYEIVTSRLTYYTGRGFEVDVPLRRWYESYQTASPLRCPDWEAFRDPRETTYTAYTRLMHEREGELAAFAAAHPLQPDTSLAAARASLAAAIGPARHLLHGLHMVSAYVGHMAPSGRIILCAAFQAADEMGRVEHLARRLALLLSFDPALTAGRERWQSAPRWQPARETVERLLVTYDWGEAFAALCLCVKPVLDAALHRVLRREAERAGDELLGRTAAAFDRTCSWHWAWAAALAKHALISRPANAAALQPWVDLWLPRAAHAAEVLADEPASALCREHVKRLGDLGLRVPPLEAAR